MLLHREASLAADIEARLDDLAAQEEEDQIVIRIFHARLIQDHDHLHQEEAGAGRILCHGRLPEPRHDEEGVRRLQGAHRGVEGEVRAIALIVATAAADQGQRVEHEAGEVTVGGDKCD